jgi:hypothetical protein
MMLGTVCKEGGLREWTGPTPARSVSWRPGADGAEVEVR